MLGEGFLKAIFGSVAGPLFLFIGLGIMFYTFSLLNVNLIPILALVIAFSPLWLPVALFYIFFERWKDYLELKFQDTQGRATLRIKLPQDVFKSPEAMEGVFTQIFNPNPSDNLLQTYIDGKYPLTSSFELASIGGEVRFYANVPRKKVKNALEAQLYAQYPGVEVVEEVIDYTAEIKNDLEAYDWMSFHIGKKKEEVLPIKTYIDFGHDKMPKEEEKYEPMAPLIEHLGKAKPNERIWIQILITPHVKRNIMTGSLREKPNWEAAVRAKIDLMMGREAKIKNDDEYESQTKLTMGERDTIAAMERNVGKFAYETVIRAMYIAEKNTFDGEMIGPILRAFSQFEVVGRNGFGLQWRTDFDYNFISDPSGSRRRFHKKRELDYYKMRNYQPCDVKTYADKPKVFSVEELATIYHIPGKTIVTPALVRVESVRRNAPSNLPTGNFTNSWS
jgi:hypothetical protein